MERLWDNQDDYNRLKSDDRDALKFNMFPQRVFRDANQETMDRDEDRARRNHRRTDRPQQRPSG